MQFIQYFTSKIGPTRKSDAKRKAIFNKVKQLIEKAYSTPVHVLRYGSDPLKTYMPDSDIDITVIPSLAPLIEEEKLNEQESCFAASASNA